MAVLTPARKEELHRRGLLLEWFTFAWNVIEGVVAIGAGIVTGSVSLVAFGADSYIEVISAVALLWRLRKAGPHASAEERGAAELRALYLVVATFSLLAAYITYEAVGALLSREGPETSTVGLVLSVVSLLVMPTLAYGKHRTGRETGSEALQADAVETWVCSNLSLALLAGVGLNAAFGWWWADPAGGPSDVTGNPLEGMGDLRGGSRGGRDIVLSTAHGGLFIEDNMDGAQAARTSSSTVRTGNHLKVRFSATVGGVSEVEVALV